MSPIEAVANDKLNYTNGKHSDSVDFFPGRPMLNKVKLKAWTNVMPPKSLAVVIRCFVLSL